MNPPRLRSSRRALAALAVLTLCGSPLTLHAEDPEEPDQSALLEEASAAFEWQGEELYYTVKVNDTEAAQAVIRVGEVRLLKDKPYVALSAKAKSVGLFDSVYPMDDRANTYLDPYTFKPMRSEKFFKESGKSRTYEVDYDHDAYTIGVHKIWHKSEKTPEEKERTYTRPIPGMTFDALSWFFDLRAKAEFIPDEVHSYYIEDGWRLSRVDLTVVGEERVLTPMGWFTSTRFDFTREGLRALKKTEDGTIVEPELEVKKPAQPFGSVWLSNDSRRIPVKVQVVSSLGTGEVFLAKYVKPTKKKKKKSASAK